MTDYALFASLDILKRLIELDLPKPICDAFRKRTLSWKHFFSHELEHLKSNNCRKPAARWWYDDTIVDYIAFVRNRLVHQGGLADVARRICAHGDPLEVILGALEQSENDQVMPIVLVVQELQSASPAVKKDFQRLQETVQDIINRDAFKSYFRTVPTGHHNIEPSPKWASIESSERGCVPRFLFT
jgi:hypothetical protein